MPVQALIHENLVTKWRKKTLKFIEKNGRRLFLLRESFLPGSSADFRELAEDASDKYRESYDDKRSRLVESKAEDVRKTLLKLKEESDSPTIDSAIDSILAQLNDKGVEKPKFRVWKFPIARYDHKNYNGRIYPKQLFTNVCEDQRDVWCGLCGLADHPKEDNDPGLFKDQAIVWLDMEVADDGYVYGVGSFCGPYGELAQQIIDRGGRVGFSTSGFGEVDKFTKTVDPKTFQIERLADVVLSPSQGVYGSLADPHTEPEPALIQPNQTIEYERNTPKEVSLEGRAVRESTTPESKIIEEKKMAAVDAAKLTEAAPAASKMEEKLFRKYVETFVSQIGSKENPMDRLKEAAEILEMFEDGVAPDLKESVELRVVQERDELAKLVESAIDVQKTLGANLDQIKENAPKIVEKAIGLRDQVTDYEELAEALTERNRELAAEVASLTKQIKETRRGAEDSADKVVKALELEKEKLEKRLTETQKTAGRNTEALELRVKNLRKRLDEAVEEAARTRSEAGDDLKSISEKKAEIEARLRETLDNEKKARFVNKREAAKLERALEAVKSGRREALTEAETTKLELARTQRELAATKRRARVVETKAALREKRASDSVKKLEREVVSLREAIDVTTRKLTEATRKVREAETESAEKRRELRKKGIEGLRETAVKDTEITKLSESNVALEKKNGVLETQLRKAAKLLEEMKGAKDAEVALKEKIVAKAAETDAKLNAALNENSLLRERVTETEEALVQLDEQFADYKKAIAEARDPLMHVEPRFEAKVGKFLNFREDMGQRIEAYWGDLVSKYGESVVPYERHIRGAKTLNEATQAFLKFKDYIDPRFAMVKESTLDESAIHSRADRVKLLSSAGVPVYREQKTLDEINEEFVKRNLGKGQI